MTGISHHAHPNPGGLSPVALAFIGDGVYELMVRERLLAQGGMPAGKLHKLAVGRVKASAQALAYDAVLAVCTEGEGEILRRGRNVSLSRLPKSCTPQEYHRATAIEALLGYLYLSGENARLEKLFALIEREITAHPQR